MDSSTSKLEDSTKKMAIHEHLGPGFTSVTPQHSPGGTVVADPTAGDSSSSNMPPPRQVHDLHPVPQKPASADTTFAAAQALQQRGGSRARPDILATGNDSTNPSTPNSPDVVPPPSAPASTSTTESSQIGTSEGARSTPISPVQSILGKFGGVLSGKHVNAPGAAGLASARGVESPGSGSATPPQFIFPKLGSRRASEHHPIGSDRSGSVLSGRRGSGAVSPEPLVGSGATTPVEEYSNTSKEIGGKSKKKEKTGEHHNPLHDLRRVS